MAVFIVILYSRVIYFSLEPPLFNDTNESEISFIPSHNEKNIVNESEPKIDVSTMERSLKTNEANLFKTPSKSNFYTSKF